MPLVSGARSQGLGLAFASESCHVAAFAMTGANLRKARAGDLAERGAVSVHVTDFLCLDHQRRSRSARSEHRAPARSSQDEPSGKNGEEELSKDTRMALARYRSRVGKHEGEDDDVLEEPTSVHDGEDGVGPT